MMDEREHVYEDGIAALPWWAVLLCMVFVLLPGCAAAPQAKPLTVVHSFQIGQDAGLLFEEPCSKAKVLAVIPPQYRDRFHDADSTYHGEKFDLCWAYVYDAEQGDVVLVWEDGGVGGIPKAVLKPGTGV